MRLEASFARMLAVSSMTLVLASSTAGTAAPPGAAARHDAGYGLLRRLGDAPGSDRRLGGGCVSDSRIGG
jgi:hypothetical protein